MGLKFDLDKDKKIGMVVETSGIDDPSKLNFVFNIDVDGVRYGFPCKIEENKVIIKVPALRNVIKKVKTGEYKASLDVMGDKNYYLQPFNESVELTQEPKLDVIIDDNDKEPVKEALTATVARILEIDDEQETIEESKDDDSINTIEDSNEDKPSDKTVSIVSKMFE